MIISEKKRKILGTLALLNRIHGDAHCALVYTSPLQLLIATILSAQCTDIRVNKVTDPLFKRYPDASAFAGADLEELEQLIHSTGFYRNKAKNIIGCTQILVDKYAGEVPDEMDALVALPGVGRKTANVVRGNAFGLPGMVVDTHIGRVARRLGWTAKTDPVQVETALSKLIPEEMWTQTSHVLIFHGRRFCKAQVPLCSTCPVQSACLRKGVKKSR